MSLDGKSGQSPRCDLCGRTAPIARRYLLLSRRVLVPDERPPWQRTAEELPPEEREFRGHEYSVCPACERRKYLAWIVAAAGITVWIPLVWKHAGVGFAYLFLFFAAFAVLARWVPVNQLLRRLRRERRAEFPELLKRRRIAYQFLTPGAAAIQQGASAPSPATAVRDSDRESHAHACSRCGSALEELGVPTAIQLVQSYRSVVDIGTETVPEAVKRDPFLYRGLFCPACRKAFCPPCAGQQAERCPACGAAGLQPAYRPYLNGSARS